MKKLLLIAATMTFSSVSCTNKHRKDENSAQTKEAQVKVGKSWDYNKIREARDAENAQQPSSADLKKMAEEDSNCTVMSTDQMIRSKASGCRPLDARSGLGGDYCCPRDK